MAGIEASPRLDIGEQRPIAHLHGGDNVAGLGPAQADKRHADLGTAHRLPSSGSSPTTIRPGGTFTTLPGPVDCAICSMAARSHVSRGIKPRLASTAATSSSEHLKLSRAIA